MSDEYVRMTHGNRLNKKKTLLTERVLREPLMCERVIYIWIFLLSLFPSQLFFFILFFYCQLLYKMICHTRVESIGSNRPVIMMTRVSKKMTSCMDL